MNLPTSAACHDVPQATIVTLSIAAELFVGQAHFVQERLRRSTDTRPRIVSRSACGCSTISFNMKCL